MHLTPNQELFFDLNITFICHNMIESPHLKVLIFLFNSDFHNQGSRISFD